MMLNVPKGQRLRSLQALYMFSKVKVNMGIFLVRYNRVRSKVKTGIILNI